MEHITSVQFWMGVSLGTAVGCLFAYLGYVLHTSQKDAERVDTRIKLVVELSLPDGQVRKDVIPVRDQDEAQRRLNEYFLSNIVSALVYDPMGDKRVLAKMHQGTGRLLGV